MKAKKDLKIFLAHILESIGRIEDDLAGLSEEKDIPKLKKQISKLFNKF